MKPARFDYARPASLGEALRLLADGAGEAQILAGGQSLVPMLNLRMARPALLIDINRLPELDLLTADAQGLHVGARVRHAQLLAFLASGAEWPLIRAALAHVAHPGVRNRGTICGSLALADPAAEAPAYALALDARIRLASARGERTIEAQDFFTGIYETARAPDEMIVGVHFPRRAPEWRFSFGEVAQRRGDYALAGLCAALRREGGRIKETRLVYFALADRPLRLRAAERALEGREASDPDARADARAALGDLPIMAGGGCSADYKLHLARVLLDRALDETAED